MGDAKKKSKKRSATNSRPPRKVTFFVDASLGGKVVAQALRDAGAKIEIHDDHFAQGTPDEEWLQEVGVRQWVVLTKDERIRYHNLARTALLNANVRAFVLTAKNLRGQENAEIFVKALPRINRLLSRHQGPFLAKVTRRAAVVMLKISS